MFARVVRWFGRTFLGRSYDQDRFVFHYRDGTRKRAADPVRVETSLQKSLGADWVETVRKLGRPAPVGLVGAVADEYTGRQQKVREEVLAAICKAFDVQPFTDYSGTRPPAGLTEVELFDLLGGYLRFGRLLAEMARPFATAQSRASPTPASRTSTSGSGSGSSATRSSESVNATPSTPFSEA